MKKMLCVIVMLPMLLLACTEAGIQPFDDEPKSKVDDLLTVQGTVCTQPPGEVKFPVKIMMIVDGSGSMQFTDPSDSNTTTVINGGVPSYDQKATASCLSACNATGTGNCTKICSKPGNPGRQGAALALVDRFKNNPSVSFAIIRFNGRVTINGSSSSNVGEFVNDEATLTKAINSLGQADITTDYQGALTAAYQLLEKDMLKTNPVDRARTKYVVIFLSDGGPNPQCKKGCGNDSVDIGGGITLDDWCDLPRDEWCDNFNITNSAYCKDMTNWYPHMKEPCREYNTPLQLKQRVMEIMSLGDTYSVGELRINTAFLFVPSLPKAIQDLMQVQGSSNATCKNDADCTTANEKCVVDGVSGKCKGPSEKLLIDMAAWGKGVFRNFSSGQQIDFLSFNYSSVSRPFGMTNFIVTNENALPNFNKLDVDSDGDGISDDVEFGAKLKMKSGNPDSDGDGYNDKLEYDRRMAGFDPGDPKKPQALCNTGSRKDDDGDGLNDCEEKVLGTDPKLPDTDRDRIPDGIEFYWGTNPLSVDDKLDTDFDGKLSGDEIRVHASPVTADPKIHAEYKYIYDVKHQPPRPDLRQCYTFTVRRVRLVTTTEKTVAGTLGYNDIMVYFGEGPADDPRDFGDFQAACVRAQFVKDSYKFPADGKVTLKDTDFMQLKKLIPARAAALKDPNCKKTPPAASCADPCKGAPIP